MYIHSYQIHNVLNVYRKQLSQGPATSNPQPSTSASAKESVTISANGQKQSIFNKISAEIVDRITEFSPENQFVKVLADQLSTNKTERKEKDTHKETNFTYTRIDEQNRKTTNTLPIRKLSPFINNKEP